MKTIFKSLLFVALFGGIATSANAQSLGATANTGATARILKQITLLTDTVQFGAVAAGIDTPFLSPTDPSQNTNVGFNARVGRLVVDASPNEPVRVEFDSVLTMYFNGVTTVAGADSLIHFVPQISVKDSTLAWSVGHVTGATLLSKDIPATNTNVAATNNTGFGPFGIVQTQTLEKATLWIGGKLYASPALNDLITSANTRTGRYVGSLSFNVIYQN
ncbi:MAG: hypothetical protein C0424_12035 [Sphingobacteriaceae bacterium]|nr:hypothetical protein [Sphingobacteriaceae bacterium]